MPVTRIDAEEAAHRISRWPWQGFVSLCNALLRLQVGPNVDRIPRLTERPGSDGGADARWHVTVAAGAVPQSPLCRVGENLYQYKQRDVSTAPRATLANRLQKELTGEVARVEKNLGVQLSNYVLWTNVHLTGGQAGKIETALKADLPADRDVATHVVHAATLAAMLVDHPHVRFCYFDSERFRTWEEAWNSHAARQPFERPVALLAGRGAELERLRSWLSDDSVRAILVTGPPGVGKTRISLESTRDNAERCVEAIDPGRLRDDDVYALESRDIPHVLVDDMDEDVVLRMVELSFRHPRVKLLATTVELPSRLWLDFPDDGRIRHLVLEPLPDAESRSLLRSLDQAVPWNVGEWILGQAGGMPRVIVDAGSRSASLAQDGLTLVEQLASSLWRSVQDRAPEAVLQLTPVLSVLNEVDLPSSDAQSLFEVCGTTVTSAGLRDALDWMQLYGIRGGSGRRMSVHPPYLANYLAARTLQPETIEQLLAHLSPEGCSRLFSRLALLESQEVTRLLDALARSGVLLADGPDLAERIRWLRTVAGSVPSAVLAVLRRREGLSFGEAAVNREVVELVNLLTEIPATAGEALTLLRTLAYHEQERHSISAAHRFASYFSFHHPTAVLPPLKRIQILSEMRESLHDPSVRALLLLACDNALTDNPHLLPTAHLQRHPEPRPFALPQDWKQYWLAAADLAMACVPYEPENNKIPWMLFWLGKAWCGPEAGLERFESLLSMEPAIVDRLPAVDVDDALATMERELGELIDDGRSEFEPARERCRRLRQNLQAGSFATRLRRMTGHFSREDLREEVRVGRSTWMAMREAGMQSLAREAAENPELLTVPLLEWLLSGEAPRSAGFFIQLGIHDSRRAMLAGLLSTSSVAPRIDAIVSYLSGWDQASADEIETVLEDLDSRFPPDIMLRFATAVRPTLSGVQRVVRLLEKRAIDPKAACSSLERSGWLEQLAVEGVARMLELLLGPGGEGAAYVIRLAWEQPQEVLDRWLDSAIRELLWSALEACPVQASDITAPASDSIAARLSSEDANRGLALLRRLLLAIPQPLQIEDVEHPVIIRSPRWDPLYPHSPHAFWDQLVSLDPLRTVETVLDAADDPTLSWLVPWNLRGFLRQESLQDALLQYASKGETPAVRVVRCLNSRREGFWPLASRLLEGHPTSEALRQALTGSLFDSSAIAWGSDRSRKEEVLAQVRGQQGAPGQSVEMRSWLADVEMLLQQERVEDVNWEYDLGPQGVQQALAGPPSPLRTWAVKRVLLRGRPEDLRRLRRDDVRDVLPELPPDRRRTLERMLEVWERHA